MKILFVLLALTSFAQAAPTTSEMATNAADALAKPTEIKNYGQFYISGTPTEQQLADFKKKNGGASVLDLRSFDELGNCTEPAATVKAGLQYNRVNFEAGTNPKIDPQVIADIDKAVAANDGKPMLLFCKSGSRAASWLAIHLVRDEKMPKEQAIAKAKELGLTPNMEKAVRTYLK